MLDSDFVEITFLALQKEKERALDIKSQDLAGAGYIDTNEPSFCASQQP